MNINKHGLSRHIPKAVKYEIRKNSGWGCIICGSGIIHYDHVDPEFVDCIEHNSKNMTLLCPRCHDKKTRKFLSVDTIKAAMKNPKALQKGFSNEFLDLGPELPDVLIGGNLVKGCKYPLTVSNIAFMEINPPEETGAPCKLSAEFLDLEGKVSLSIHENEWKTYNSNWDFEATGGKIKVLYKKNIPALILDISSPKKIVIEAINCIIDGKLIRGNQNLLQVKDLKNGGVVNYGGNYFQSEYIGFEL